MTLRPRVLGGGPESFHREFVDDLDGSLCDRPGCNDGHDERGLNRPVKLLPIAISSSFIRAPPKTPRALFYSASRKTPMKKGVH